MGDTGGAGGTADTADGEGWMSETTKEAEMEWQPIETAPKDGMVLVWDGYPRIAWQERGVWRDSDEFFAQALNPTHWMPLPDPPTP